MPLPTSINDLSTSEASNSPAGTESPQTFDNYLRWHASFIAALRDVVLTGTANLTTASLTYNGTLTGSTGVINIGGGQIYKDAAGLVAIGTSTTSAKLTVYGTAKLGEGAASNTSKLMVNTVSGTAAGLQLFQDGNESWIMSIPASSTTLTWANSGTTRMSLKAAGQLNLAGLAAAPTGTAGDIYYDSVTNKHYGHNGTSWNAFY